MNKKLSWAEIRETFRDQWVELTDCDWDWEDANPNSATVLNSSTDRKKLLTSNKKDSIILFVRSRRALLGSYHEPVSEVPSYQ